VLFAKYIFYFLFTCQNASGIFVFEMCGAPPHTAESPSTLRSCFPHTGLIMVASRSESERTITEIASTEAETMKRGPGRPRKQDAQPSGSAVKRGPGRPRKQDAQPSGSAVKRGPGRPRKQDAPPSGSPVKRGPGRPRKQETPATITHRRPPAGERDKNRIAFFCRATHCAGSLPTAPHRHNI